MSAVILMLKLVMLYEVSSQARGTSVELVRSENQLIFMVVEVVQ